MIKLKRVYETPAPDDGVRVLVERLWPRGLTKEAAAVDLWVKEIAPSPELRKWYAHDPDKWPEFQRRYKAELREKPSELDEFRKVVDSETVTFVFAARDLERNSALLLRSFLEEKVGA